MGCERILLIFNRNLVQFGATWRKLPHWVCFGRTETDRVGEVPGGGLGELPHGHGNPSPLRRNSQAQRAVHAYIQVFAFQSSRGGWTNTVQVKNSSSELRPVAKVPERGHSRSAALANASRYPIVTLVCES